MEMSDLWLRYHAWMKQRIPKPFRTFSKGASERKLLKTQKLLGVEFTSDLKTFYQTHNGQSIRRVYLFDESEFLSLDRMIFEWLQWKELHDDGEFNHLESDCEPEIQPVWWDRHWIPFTENGAGDHFCIDFNPTSQGTYGQIITLFHDQNIRQKIANSIHEWFTNYVNALENGAYTYSKQTCTILKKDN